MKEQITINFTFFLIEKNNNPAKPAKSKMIDAANVDIIIIKEIEIHITYKNILNSHFCRDATAIKQGIETAKDIKNPQEPNHVISPVPKS